MDRSHEKSIINFMVYCKGSTIFLKSVEVSDNIKDNKCIYGSLKDVIKEVGEANVVQIAIDNISVISLQPSTRCLARVSSFFIFILTYNL